MAEQDAASTASVSLSNEAAAARPDGSGSNVGNEEAAAAASATSGASKPPSLEESDEELCVLIRARAQLKDALRLIPEEEKTAYTEALRRAPHLVELESHADRYLRFDGFDPWAAARRIVDYWQARVDVFGNERAFLPLVISGEGALTPGDVEVLQSGNFMALPPTAEGRPVIFYDRARLVSQELMAPEKRIRCLFYILSAISESPASQDMGLVSLSVFTNKTRQATIGFKLITDMINIFYVRQVIPVRLTRIHAVNVSTRPCMDGVIFGIIEKLASIIPKATFHTGKTVDEFQEDLRKHGFQLDGLPKVPLGGLFTLGCFRRWLDDRLRQERRTYGALLASDDDDDDNESGDDAKPAAVVPAEEDPEQEQKRKKRELEAACARRKRARRKITLKVLEAEVARHKAQQDLLRETGADLQARLAEALRFVQMYEQKAMFGELPLAASAFGDRFLSSSSLPTRTISMVPSALDPRLLLSEASEPRVVAPHRPLQSIPYPAIYPGGEAAAFRGLQEFHPSNAVMTQPLLTQPHVPSIPGSYPMGRLFEIGADPPASLVSHSASRELLGHNERHPLFSSHASAAPPSSVAVPPSFLPAGYLYHGAPSLPLQASDGLARSSHWQDLPIDQERTFQELYHLLTRNPQSPDGAPK